MQVSISEQGWEENFCLPHLPMQHVIQGLGLIHM